MTQISDLPEGVYIRENRKNIKIPGSNNIILVVYIRTKLLIESSYISGEGSFIIYEMKHIKEPMK